MAIKAIRTVSPAARTVTIVPETRLVEDLSLDSLDMVAVFVQVQDEHGIELELDDAERFLHVSDLMREINRHIGGKATAA